MTMPVKEITKGTQVRLTEAVYYGELTLDPGTIFVVMSAKINDLTIVSGIGQRKCLNFPANVSGIGQTLCLAIPVQNENLEIFHLPLNCLEAI